MVSDMPSEGNGRPSANRPTPLAAARAYPAQAGDWLRLHDVADQLGDDVAERLRPHCHHRASDGEPIIERARVVELLALLQAEGGAA